MCPDFKDVTSAVPQVLAPAARAKPVGFQDRMKMVLDLHNKVAEDRDFSEDLVHDLRVSLRRCRTIAKALNEVDPSGDWKSMDKAARRLFKALGGIRDLHVLDGWLDALAPEDDPSARMLHKQFQSGIDHELRKAGQAVEKFDRDRWKQWTRQLPDRAAKLIRQPGLFYWLAKTRMNDALQMHRQAIENPSEEAWHQVRIAIKRFRYLVENFLPELYAEWGRDLEGLQDLLGAVHDLDVLRQEIAALDLEGPDVVPEVWQAIFHKERESRLAAYRSRTTGPESLWNRWETTLAAIPEPPSGASGNQPVEG